MFSVQIIWVAAPVGLGIIIMNLCKFNCHSSHINAIEYTYKSPKIQV